MSFTPGAGPGPGQPGSHEMAQAREAERRQNLAQAAARAEHHADGRDGSDTPEPGGLRGWLRKLTGR
jgi:hypothetical protein